MLYQLESICSCSCEGEVGGKVILEVLVFFLVWKIIYLEFSGEIGFK